MTEDTKSKIQNPKSKIIWLLFVFAVVFIYFFGLTLPLLGPDEPRYSQIAREMFERGDWITPKLGGFDWFEKPALLYWLQIASYKLFGVNEFAARFGSAIFGLGTVASLWILGKAVADCRFQIPNSKTETLKIEFSDLESDNLESGIWNLEFANWLALIAASSIGLIAFSRGASFDIILTFPITASLVGFFVWETRDCKSPISNRQYLIAFYFFIGIALIAKGLVGIVFPFAIVAFYYLLSWKMPSKTFILSLIWGTILSLLVAAAWYVPMYQANGWKFVDEFFIQHHFQRFTSDKYQHHQPFWFFFVVLPLMTLPWLPFFLASIWEFFKVQGSRFKNSALRTPHSALRTFAFAWMLVPLVFFSLSGSKLPGYILPSLSGALILTAVYVARFASKSRARKMFLQSMAAAVFVLSFVVLQFFAADYTKHETVKYMIEAVDAQGFGDAKFVNLYTVSHNLEFYAAGRLIREADGKLKRYDDYSVLIKALKAASGERILIVVPLANVAQLQAENDSVAIKTLAENGESAIVLIEPK